VIDLPFDPDLVLGPVRVSWHSLLALAGMVGGGAVGIRCTRPFATSEQAYAVALAGILGGLAGGRIFHVVDQWSAYAAAPLAILAVWNGGSSIVGGIVGGMAGGIVAMRRVGVPVAGTLDGGVVGLPLGMAIGRLGDIVNGEHHATACAGLPWCVRYTSPTTLGQRDFVHPAVAYELLLDLAILAVLLFLLPRAERYGLRGRIAFVFLGLYGAGRLALGTVRLDPVFAAGLSQADLVAILFMVVSAIALVARRGRPIVERG
jgi:phosphatidylglycerol:prolipoprotein diacylglycerol transferase